MKSAPTRFCSPLLLVLLGLLLGPPLHAQEKMSIMVAWDLVVSEQGGEDQILIDFTGAGVKQPVSHVWTDMRPLSVLVSHDLAALSVSFPDNVKAMRDPGARGFNIGMPPSRGVFVLEGTGVQDRSEMRFKGSGFVCLGVESGFGRLAAPPTSCPRGAAKYLVPSLEMGIYPSRN